MQRTAAILFAAGCSGLSWAQPLPCEGWVPLPGQGNPYISGPSVVAYAAVGFDADGPGPLPDDLIVAGENLRMDGAASGNVYRWDGSRWHTMDVGFDPGVYALAVYRGHLYAGGPFAASGGRQTVALARWTGDRWEPVQGPGGGVFSRASGGPPQVRAMIVHDDKLVVVGGFTGIGTLAAGNIAAWDGTEFSTFGLGLDGYVRAVAEHAGDLVVAGDFRNAGGQRATRLARWNGAAWSFVGNSATDEGVDGIARAVLSHEGELFIGGDFRTAGRSTASRSIVAWGPGGWRSFGSDTDNSVRSLHASRFGLVAAGNFTRLAGRPARGLSFWDGASWSSRYGELTPFPERTPQPFVMTATTWNESLIIGGSFTYAGDVCASSLAGLSDTGWRGFAEGLGGGRVQFTAFYQGQVYAAGAFWSAGAEVLNGLARWDGRKWRAVPGWGRTRNPQAMFVADGKLWLSGVINPAGAMDVTVPAAMFDGERWRWAYGGPVGTPSNLGASFFDGELVLSLLGQAGGNAHFWNGETWSGPLALPGTSGHAFQQGGKLLALAREGDFFGLYERSGGGWIRLGDSGMSFIHASVGFQDRRYVSGGGLDVCSIWDGSRWALAGLDFMTSADTIRPAGDAMYIAASSQFGGSAIYEHRDGAIARTIPWSDFVSFERLGGEFFGKLMISGFAPYEGTSDGTAVYASGPPVIIGQPIAPDPCPRIPLKLDAVALGVGVSYQWRRNGVPIDGATASVYEDAFPGDSRPGDYDCVVSNPCGETISASVRYAPCFADHDCNGFIDFFDYADFVADFEIGSPRADVNRDGFIDFADYDTFVNAFENGC
ncbi:MAG: hypothetical protein HEQ23_01780 [Tepidisphaera sp.]